MFHLCVVKSSCFQEQGDNQKLFCNSGEYILGKHYKIKTCSCSHWNQQALCYLYVYRYNSWVIHRNKFHQKAYSNTLSYFNVFYTCLEILYCLFSMVLYHSLDLTWRDMQHLTVLTSKRNQLHDEVHQWRRNGVGLEFNHLFGYGVLDAGAMVKMAKDWKTVPERFHCVGGSIQEPE